MKKRINFRKRKNSPLLLPILCYSVAILIWLGSSLFSLVWDGVVGIGGDLEPMVVTPADFEVIGMEKLVGNKWQVVVTDESMGPDPQLIMENLPGPLRTLRLRAKYSGDTGEMNLYYTSKPVEEQGFSQDRRVWPVLQDDGSYLFTLPQKHIEAIRLDPASTEVEIQIESITLNEPRDIRSYFNPGWSGLVLLLIIPALAAACVSWLADVVQYYRAYAVGQRWLKKQEAKLKTIEDDVKL